MSVNEDPEKTEELIAELKELITKEEGLKVPEDRSFHLRFLRAGLSNPKDGLEIIKNYFLLRKNHFKYFKVSSITVIYFYNILIHPEMQTIFPDFFGRFGVGL